MSTPLPPQGVPPQQPPPGSGYAPHMPTQGFQPSYGSPPPGSRPSRPTMSPAKYGTTLGLAIGGALLGLIALFLPFISISAAAYGISDSESHSLLQWNSDIRAEGDDFGFNMFLFSLLVILAAIAFAVLLGLLRMMPKSVSYLAGGGLIGTGLVMFLLWILFLMDMGRLSDLIISSSASVGMTITVSGSIGFYAYFSSLSLLIASGILVFIFVRSGGSSLPSAPYSPYGPGPRMPAAGYPANPQQHGYGASVPQAPQQYGQASPSQAQAGQPYQYQQPGQPWQSPAPAQSPSPNAAASSQPAYPSASEQIQAPGSASSAGAAAPGGTSPGAPFSTSAASAGNPSAPGSPSQPGSPYAAGTPSSAGATYPAGGYGAPAGEQRAPLPSPQPSTETSYEPNSYARPDAPRQDLGTDGATGQSGVKSSD